MKMNSMGLFASVIILLCMLLLCHTMNFLYPKQNTTSNKKNVMNNDNNENSENSLSKFYNLPTQTTIPATQPIRAKPTQPLPTQYNLISYQREHAKIPCDSQAAIPCKIFQQQCTGGGAGGVGGIRGLYNLSDSELAILYKEAYEMAGNEVLRRKLIEIQNPTMTNNK